MLVEMDYLKSIIGKMKEENWSEFEIREDNLLDRLRINGRTIKNLLRKKEKPEAYVSSDLVTQYKFFRENIYNPERVFYPCCDLDISPIEGFTNSEVVLMDNASATPNLEKIMKEKNITQFIKGDVLAYTPILPFDLVIILNPCLDSKDLIRHLVSGGYVLANNWHCNASELLDNSSFEGIGTIDRNERGIYLARGDFSKLEPNQFATYFYVFKKKLLDSH